MTTTRTSSNDDESQEGKEIIDVSQRAAVEVASPGHEQAKERGEDALCREIDIRECVRSKCVATQLVFAIFE